MSNSQSEKIKSLSFFKKLSSLDFIDEIWLYGSRARGDYKERSDIDLAIVCADVSREQWIEILDIVEKADTLLKIDVVHIGEESLDEKLLKNILADKKVLFKRNR